MRLRCYFLRRGGVVGFGESVVRGEMCGAGEMFGGW